LQKTSRIILGVDPGTLLMGYSVIKVSRQKIQLLCMDVLKLSSKKDNYERLSLIHHRINTLITEYQPTEFAIEAPFFGKNVQSMLKLGRAQGVAIAAAMQGGLTVHEYSPKKIKQSITGNGNSDKEKVWKFLQQILSLTNIEITSHDVSDALAVAVCHHFQNTQLATAGKALKGWEDFIAKNPGRVSLK
jgi:crossover junction endodeoxyribonuclease RuvC